MPHKPKIGNITLDGGDFLCACFPSESDDKYSVTILDGDEADEHGVTGMQIFDVPRSRISFMENSVYMQDYQVGKEVGPPTLRIMESPSLRIIEPPTLRIIDSLNSIKNSDFVTLFSSKLNLL